MAPLRDSAPNLPVAIRDARGASSPWALLARRDFRRLFLAVVISELGDAFHYIALMWIALVTGGPLGVVGVRLGDAVPVLVFGVHSAVAADRWNRRRVMIAADVVRAIVLAPIAVAGLVGSLPLWGLIAAAVVLEIATVYFEPAAGAMLPQLVDRDDVQAANGILRASGNAVSMIGWAIAALVLTFAPICVFFALNALSFVISAALLWGIRSRAAAGADHATERPRIREGLAVLRRRPTLAAALVALGLGVTVSAGTWIGGVPLLVERDLQLGPVGLSILMIGFAVGCACSGAVLARVRVRAKARGSIVAWLFDVPSALLLGIAGTLGVSVLGAFAAGVAQTSVAVLLDSAAQEEVDDRVLGRVMGLFSLVGRGAHALALVLVAPLFTWFERRTIFVGAASFYVAMIAITLWLCRRRAR
jgi:MFS family permease